MLLQEGLDRLNVKPREEAIHVFAVMMFHYNCCPQSSCVCRVDDSLGIDIVSKRKKIDTRRCPISCRNGIT